MSSTPPAWNFSGIAQLLAKLATEFIVTVTGCFHLNKHLVFMLRLKYYRFIYLFIFNLCNVDKLTYIFNIWR